MANDKNDLMLKADGTLSSGFFLDRKTIPIPSVTPILIDNLSLRVRIASGFPAIGLFPPESLPKKRFLAPQNIASAFANPYIYPTQRGNPYLKLFGQQSLRTNGRRIYRHFIGDPLPHNTGQDKRIEAEDKRSNQLPDSELLRVLELAAANNQDPSTWQILEMVRQVQSGYMTFMETYQLEAFNHPESFRKNIGVNRLEAYLEVLGLFDYNEVTDILHKVLYKHFGSTDKRRDRFEKSHDQEDSNSFMTWVIAPRRISAELRGEDFKIKVYKKFDRVRFEIQANYPKLKEPSTWDGTSSPFTALTEDLLRIKTILGQKLELVWHEVSQSLKNPIDPFDPLPLVAARIKELRPNKSKQSTFTEVVTHIATMHAITLSDLERMGWDRNDLKVFAHPKYGFLVQSHVGVNGEGKNVRRVNNGSYVLVVDWLNRTGKPTKETKMFEPLQFENFKDVWNYSNHDPLAELSGSAIPNKKFLIG